MNKFVVRCSLFVVLLLTTNSQLPTIFAVESTTSASPSASLQTKLKELQEEIASKASALKAEVSGRLQNKAYVGKIKSITDDSLVLADDDTGKTVKVNEFTEFVFVPKIVSKLKPTIKNLEVENYIIALGDIDETETLTAKKIIKTDAPKETKQIYFGEVLAINENMLTLKTDKNLAVSTTNQTIFKNNKGNGTLTDIKIGQKVIVSGIVNNNIFKANLIYIF